MTRLCWIVLFSFVATLAGIAEAADDSGEATGLNLVVLEPNAAPPPAGAPFATQVARYRKQAGVPDDHKVRLTIKHYYEMGKGEHDMASVITPLDAQGRPDGLESEYQEYLGLIHTTHYKDGLKEGIEQVFAVGNTYHYLRLEVPWHAGKIQGVRKLFSREGKVVAETPYDNGLEEGEALTYDPDGKLLSKVVLKAGKRTGQMTNYWPGTDKPKRVVPYEGGKIEGVVHDYYLDGQLKSETPFLHDLMHGLAKEIGPDGKVIKTAWWFQGDPVTQAEFEKKSKG